ncbi:hypothetical protein EIKCOROL_02105 [Eikenella corrodens ATCC 23834]|uniref:Uncharacterized protein n=1 Tax=Eikenella corrodens ATCC 23834 TaxID=546274 RepID=C0DXJ4_EIKCO|nr:hypothetical protein EIKCOROL_02105 [Eikenella corrodens ATCC 23834]
MGRIERLPENKTAVLPCRCRFFPAAISRHNKRLLEVSGSLCCAE